MYIDEHLQKWDELHSASQFRLKYPNENIIRFVKGQFPQKKSSHILDLGSGAGRHVVFLAQEGYQATGFDFSKEGLEFTREVLNLRSLEADLVEGSIVNLPFDDNQFDGIICFGVLYYLEPYDIKVTVQEIYRTLKTGGKAFIVVRSCQDKRYGRGELVSENTYKLNTNFSNEEGMIIHFFTREEVEELFHSFSEIKIGLNQESFDSLNEFNSDYLITLTK